MYLQHLSPTFSLREKYSPSNPFDTECDASFAQHRQRGGCCGMGFDACNNPPRLFRESTPKLREVL